MHFLCLSGKAVASCHNICYWRWLISNNHYNILCFQGTNHDRDEWLYHHSSIITQVRPGHRWVQGEQLQLTSCLFSAGPRSRHQRVLVLNAGMWPPIRLRSNVAHIFFFFIWSVDIAIHTAFRGDQIRHLCSDWLYQCQTPSSHLSTYSICFV